MESLRPQNKAKRLGFGEKWALGFGEGSREGRLWGPSSRGYGHAGVWADSGIWGETGSGPGFEVRVQSRDQETQVRD